jgi:hypothetical protein
MLRRCGIAAVAVAMMVGMVACLPVPLGDPAKAVADARYVGAWQWKEGDRNHVTTIRSWDDRTYVVDIMMFEGELASPTPKGRLVYKGWLADVKGKTFLNLQQIEFLTGLPGEKREKYFMIAKLELSGDQLTATGLDGGYEPFKTITTTTDLEKVVGEKMDDAKMWAKPIVAKKLGQDQMDALEKLAKKYEE